MTDNADWLIQTKNNSLLHTDNQSDEIIWIKDRSDWTTRLPGHGASLGPSMSNSTQMFDLHDLNNKQAAIFAPVFAVLSCIIILGVLFNILVCYIYKCRSRRATSNFFVIFFAIFDITGCCVGIPLEICALCLPYMFTMDPLCRIIGFIETFSVCSLCLTLICVSFDCFRKHSRPSEVYGVKKARNSCIVAIIIALVLSLPALFVFQSHEKLIPVDNTERIVWSCAIDVQLPMWLRCVYYISVLMTFTVSLVIMTILYCAILVNYLKQKQAEERGEKPANTVKRNFPKKHRFVREDTSTSSATTYAEEITRLQTPTSPNPHHHTSSSHFHTHSSSAHSDLARMPLRGSSSSLAKDSTRSINQKGSTAIVKTNSLQASSPPPSTLVVQLQVKSSRQTSIFLVICVAFVATMLPYIVITVLCMTTEVFYSFSSKATEIAYHLCVRSYLFNFIWKPVVYLIFNINFRKEVKLMFCRLWKLCTFSSAGNTQNSTQLKRSFTMGPSSRSASRVPIYRPPQHSV